MFWHSMKRVGMMVGGGGAVEHQFYVKTQQNMVIFMRCNQHFSVALKNENDVTISTLD